MVKLGPFKYLSLVYAMVGPIRANKNLIVYNMSGCKQNLMEPKVLSTLFDIEYVQFNSSSNSWYTVALYIYQDKTKVKIACTV